MRDSGVSDLIRAVYHLLGLRTYLTTGIKETRAWTIPSGAKAPQAAGVIHTDFERGFIAAEVVHYDDLVSCGGKAGAREHGKLRIEGKRICRQRRGRYRIPLQCLDGSVTGIPLTFTDIRGRLLTTFTSPHD